MRWYRATFYRAKQHKILGNQVRDPSRPRTRDPIGLRQGSNPFFFVVLDFVTGGREIKIAFPIGPCSTVRMKVPSVGFGMGCNQGCNPFNHKMKNHVTVFSFRLGDFIRRL